MLDKVAGRLASCRQRPCGQLPFELGRQACAGPARQRIGLEKIKVAGWRVGVDIDQALQGEVAIRCTRIRALTAAFPIEGHVVLAGLHPVPAHRKPELGPPVAAVGHERQQVAIGDQPAGQLKWRNENLMPGVFVVKTEFPVQRCIESMFDHTTRISVPALRRRTCAGEWPAPRIRWCQRIEGQGVFDIGEDQFLVLLFMLQAKLDQL